MAAERAQFAFPQSLLTVLQSGQIFVLRMIAFATAGTLPPSSCTGPCGPRWSPRATGARSSAVRLGAMALFAVLLLGSW